MIIKQKNGTILEMTPEEFAELGGVLAAPFEVDALAKGSSEVATVFKIGDTVEIVGVNYLGKNRHLGKIGKIKKIFIDGDFGVKTIKGGGGVFRKSSLKLIEEEPEEVLSKDNVKAGEYFVVTYTTSGHRFKIGEVVKSLDTSNDDSFSAERIGDSYWWWADVLYTNVRRATAEEIAEATKPKPKEVKFEIGDVVESGGLFAKIFDDFDSGDEYYVGFFNNGCFSYLDESDMRHATEEEKSHLQTLIGREKDEYKVGDLVRLEATGLHSSLRTHVGSIFEISHINEIGAAHLMFGDNRNDTLAYTKPENLKLITPVEWRHDFK